jgi:hypothetical protein
MQGTGSASIDFAKLSFTSQLAGTVLAPAIDAYTNGQFPLGPGTSFMAIASGTLDMVNKGGFTGQFSQACFATACTSGNALVIAGSSLDGAFFGPGGEEIGVGFRIVGGRPDQRIDILGAFTGKK